MNSQRSGNRCYINICGLAIIFFIKTGIGEVCKKLAINTFSIIYIVEPYKL